MSVELFNTENHLVYNMMSLCEGKVLKEKGQALTEPAGCVGDFYHMGPLMVI